MNIPDVLNVLEQYQNEGNDWQALFAAIQTNFSGTKTPLGLNQWQQTDKPRMEHFNEDNRRIDELIRELQTNKVAKETLTEHPIEYKEGIVTWHASIFCQSPFGETIVNLSCKKNDATQYFTHTEVIATLPQGFRPKNRLEINGSLNATGGKQACTLYIEANGNIVVLLNGQTNVSAIFLSAAFLAAQ